VERTRLASAAASSLHQPGLTADLPAMAGSGSSPLAVRHRLPRGEAGLNLPVFMTAVSQRDNTLRPELKCSTMLIQQIVLTVEVLSDGGKDSEELRCPIAGNHGFAICWDQRTLKE